MDHFAGLDGRHRVSATGRRVIRAILTAVGSPRRCRARSVAPLLLDQPPLALCTPQPPNKR
jgi:hypothetical protein